MTSISNLSNRPNLSNSINNHTVYKAVLHIMPVPLCMNHTVSFAQTHGTNALSVLHRAQYFIVENARTARRMLAGLGLKQSITDLNITEIPRHVKPEDWHTFLSPILAGHELVLLSEAGCPAVADPGALLVRAAYAAGIEVIAHVGPSSLLLALMASGMNGQSFAFVGYIPQDSTARKHRLIELETHSKLACQTQIIIETPYRNQVLVDSILQVCKPNTLLGIALDLTTPNAYNQTRPVSKWHQQLPVLSKRQMVLTVLA